MSLTDNPNAPKKPVEAPKNVETVAKLPKIRRATRAKFGTIVRTDRAKKEILKYARTEEDIQELKDAVILVRDILDRGKKRGVFKSPKLQNGNKSVKIDLKYYELLKRHAFENEIEIKEILDGLISRYINENIVQIAKENIEELRLVEINEDLPYVHKKHKNTLTYLE